MIENSQLKFNSLFDRISKSYLSIKDITSFEFSWGALLVLLATLSWGFENNCTRNLSSKNTYKVVFIKGIFSGLGSLIVAIILKETFNNLMYYIFALLFTF